MPMPHPEARLIGELRRLPRGHHGQFERMDDGPPIHGVGQPIHVHGVALPQLTAALREEPRVLDALGLGTGARIDPLARVTAHQHRSAREGGLRRKQQGEHDGGEPDEHDDGPTSARNSPQSLS